MKRSTFKLGPIQRAVLTELLKGPTNPWVLFRQSKIDSFNSMVSAVRSLKRAGFVEYTGERSKKGTGRIYRLAPVVDKWLRRLTEDPGYRAVGFTLLENMYNMRKRDPKLTIDQAFFLCYYILVHVQKQPVPLDKDLFDIVKAQASLTLPFVDLEEGRKMVTVYVPVKQISPEAMRQRREEARQTLARLEAKGVPLTSEQIKLLREKGEAVLSQTNE